MSIKEVVPFGNRVIILPTEVKGTSDGGIIIPDVAKEKPQTGKIVTCGPGIFNPQFGQEVPLNCKVGDTVLYQKYSGVDFEYEGENYLIMKESDLIVKLPTAQ